MDLENYVFDYPWKHYVFDNFLDDKTLSHALNFIKEYKYIFKIDRPESQKIQYSLNFDNRLNEIFISESFQSFLEYITECKLDFFEPNFVQLRKMDISSPVFKKHVDIIDNQKSLVVILYMNKKWSNKNKGELLLYDKFRSPKRDAKIIEPILNRLVLLPTANSNWHSVERVKDAIRYSIIHEWIVVQQES